MKSVIAAGLIATALMSPSAAADSGFAGSFVVTAANSGCAVLPYLEQSSVFQATVRQRGNGNSAMKLGNFEIQLIMVSRTDLLATSPVSLTTTEIRDFPPSQVDDVPSFKSFGAFRYPVTMTIVEKQPSSVLPSTTTLSLRGQIRGFGGARNCSVDFRAGFTRL